MQKQQNKTTKPVETLSALDAILADTGSVNLPSYSDRPGEAKPMLDDIVAETVRQDEPASMFGEIRRDSLAPGGEAKGLEALGMAPAAAAPQVAPVEPVAAPVAAPLLTRAQRRAMRQAKAQAAQDDVESRTVARADASLQERKDAESEVVSDICSICWVPSCSCGDRRVVLRGARR